jgi:DNA repair exonuclease SbcCD ATPase subunit
VSSILQEQRELLNALTDLAQRGDPVRNVKDGVAVIKTARPIMELARASGGDVVRSHEQLSAILDVLIERGQDRPKSRDKIRDLALSWRRAIALGQKELPQLQSRCEELQRNLTSAHSDVEALRSELGELKERHQSELSDLSQKLSASGKDVQRHASAAQQLRTEVLKLREEFEAQAKEVQRLTSLQNQELEWADRVADDLALVVDAYSVLAVVTSYLQLCWKDEPEEDRRRWLLQAIQPVKSALDQRNQHLLETCGERAFDLYRSCFFGVAEVGESTFEVLACTAPSEASFKALCQSVRTRASSEATTFVVKHLPVDLQPSVHEILQ